MNATGASAAIPAGFAPHERRSGLTAPWEPLYARLLPEAVYIGFRAAAPHTNSRHFVHGGLISALADNAMGLSCGLGLREASGLVTVNLTMDFVASAALGQWVEVRPHVTRLGGSLAFATVAVFADAQICASGSAVFRVLGPRAPA